jgi:hypothetical protein
LKKFLTKFIIYVMHSPKISLQARA